MTAWMGNRDEHNNRCMRDVLVYINSMELAHLTRFHCRFKGKSSLLSFPNSTPKTHFSPQILQSLKMQIPLAPYSRDPRTLPSRFWPHLRGSSRQYLYRSQRRGCDPYHGPHAADTEDTKASVCDADVCTSVLECVGGVDVGCGVFRVVGRWVLVCGEL